MILTTVYDCSLIELSKHHHEKGNITVVENILNHLKNTHLNIL